MILIKVLDIELSDNGTVTDFFEGHANSDILNYEHITFKKRSGINLWTEEEDFLFMIRKDSQ